jgi:HlyD family secretion protein
MLSTHNQKVVPSLSTDEFLPPVSRWTSLAGIFLVGTVGGAIALASWVKYNVTVKAAAAVRPTGEIRLVQPEMEGTVKNIFVKPNQVVKQGDAIASLDDLELHIKSSQLQGNIQEGQLQLGQIDAQVGALNNQIDAEKKVTERTISSAQVDLTRNLRDFQDRQVTTQNDVLAAEADLQRAEAQLQKAQADLDFAKMDRDRYQQLSEIGAIGRREYEQKKLVVQQTQSILQAENKAVEIAKTKVRSAKTGLNPSNATVAIAQQRIAQETAKGESSVAALIREKNVLMQRRIEMRNQIIQAQKELEKNQLQLRSSVIRASSDGVILKLNLRNTGQVVRPSESIAEIVPQGAPLVMKAMIPASEIKKVAVGQNVQLRVDACPYPDYGTLKGVVSAVSPDAITSTSNNTGAATTGAATVGSYFEATIKPANLSFGNNHRNCLLQAGMDAKADIISKEETALQFMLRRARIISDL